MLEQIICGTPITFLIFSELFLVSAFSAVYQNDKKKHWGIKLLSAFFILVFVELFDYYFVSFENASTALQAPLCFGMAWFYLCVILSVPIKEALYCSIWSYLITEILTQTVMPIVGIISRGENDTLRILSYLLLFAAVIAIAVWIIVTYLSEELQTNHHYHVGRQKLLSSIMIALLYLVICNYQFIFWLLGYEPESGSNMITIFRLIMGWGCVCFLYLQNNIEKRQAAEQERNMIQQLWHRQQEQYQLSQENIELINRKCHDLKYQIRAFQDMIDSDKMREQMKELEHSVMIYDSVMKTGNAVLDTVLTEKSLYCEAHQINMTCMVDGSALDFIERVDLYTIFGNALDNAIESVMKQSDIQKRVIQVSVFQEKEFLMIRIRNYCDLHLKFVNGLPSTTKDDKRYHGFGLKSIRYTAEKYGGQMVCETKEHFFCLQILIPIHTATSSANEKSI